MQTTRQPRKLLGSVLRIALSLGLLALVLRQVGWEQTWEAFRGAQLSYLTAALGLAFASIVVRAFRWKILLDALGVRASLRRLTELYFIGTFFSTFLPTGVGGDVVRAYELAKQSERPAEVVGTVLLDRAAGLLVLFLIAAAALPFSHRLIGPEIVGLIVTLTVLGWGALTLLLRRDWLERLGLLRWASRVRALDQVYESVYACGTRATGGALAASLVLNALLIGMNYLIGLSLGVFVSLWYYLLFVPIISFLLVLPISLSGLGLREGGYVYLFAQAGVPAPLALTISLMVYAFNVATGSVGGILYAAQGLRGLRRAIAE